MIEKYYNGEGVAIILGRGCWWCNETYGDVVGTEHNSTDILFDKRIVQYILDHPLDKNFPENFLENLGYHDIDKDYRGPFYLNVIFVPLGSEFVINNYDNSDDNIWFKDKLNWIKA